MSPVLFLWITIATTLMGLLVHVLMRRRRSDALRALAAEWKMHYTVDDRFHLCDRIAGLLDVPGAASIRIGNVIYGIEADHYRYYFTTEYTLGVLRKKTDHRRAATVSEPKDREQSPAALGPLALAPESLDLMDQ